MSAGNFTTTVYDADYVAQLHPIRVQPETLAAAIGTTTNAATVGTPDSPISAIVSASTRSLGLHARAVFMKIAGTPPTNYSTNTKVRIPALTTTFYNAAVKGATVSYLGTTWTVTGRRPEIVR